MEFLGPVAVLGGFIVVATFLVIWNFRGRGFSELLPSRWSASRPADGSGGQPRKTR